MIATKANDKYTEEEKIYIEEHWGRLKLKTIAKTLGRTENAIKRYGENHKLGGMYDGYYTTYQLADMFGVNSKTVLEYWIKKYGLKAVKKTIHKKMKYVVDPKDLVDWLRENQNKWTSHHLEEYALGYEWDWLIEKRKEDSNKLPRRNWTTLEEHKALELFKQGLNSRQVSEALATRSYLACKRKLDRFKKLGLL